MDFSQVKLEDAVPIMHDLEKALNDKRVQVVSLSDGEDCVFATMTRAHAELMLSEMERQFFAKAN